MALDGSGVRRLTHTPGYDGGAFFSPDGKKIVYRAHHPRDAELASFQGLLAEQKVRPTRLEIWVMDADGANARQVTDNGAANFAPYFHPDGKRILFASNLHDPKGRNFDLYLIGLDGNGLERVTWDAEFDSFPMFSPDGKRLVWASNRQGAQPGDTNLFVADWVD
jgi:Tol biopolymer transport system component